MPLDKHFDSVKPRERSGPISSDRSHYQKDWALCKLLKLHADGSDYLIAFDIHDDVVIFQPEHSPTTIYFFQIKTKEIAKTAACWTAAALLARKKGKTGELLASIIGKLYDDAILFPEYTRKLTLVSNAPFKIGLAKDNKTAVLLSDALTPFEKLPEKHKSQIKEALQKEHALEAAPILDQLLWFDKSDVPLESHSTFAKGRLAEFLESRKAGKYNVPLAYRVLIDEVRRKNDYSQESLDFSTMRQLKAIGRSAFEKILSDAVPDDSAERTWPEVAANLQAEGFTLSSRTKLRRAWKRVETYRTDSSNSAFWELVGLAKVISPKHDGLQQLLSIGLNEMKNAVPTTFGFDEDILRGVLLMTAHDLL